MEALRGIETVPGIIITVQTSLKSSVTVSFLSITGWNRAKGRRIDAWVYQRCSNQTLATSSWLFECSQEIIPCQNKMVHHIYPYDLTYIIYTENVWSPSTIEDTLYNTVKIMCMHASLKPLMLAQERNPCMLYSTIIWQQKWMIRQYKMQPVALRMARYVINVVNQQTTG